MCKNEFFSKFIDEKRIFQSLGMKNKIHVQFRDENNSLTKKYRKTNVKLV